MLASIFTNFKNVVDSSSKSLPFGIAQIGKAFRNEITPRNFIFRVREFEQMELEFFVEPGSDEDWHKKWVQKRLDWWEDQGIPMKSIELYDVPNDELAHYSKGTVDVMYKFPHGLEELEGIANRTDFDLGSHTKNQEDLNFFEEREKEVLPTYKLQPTFFLALISLSRMIVFFIMHWDLAAFCSSVSRQSSISPSVNPWVSKKSVGGSLLPA